MSEYEPNEDNNWKRPKGSIFDNEAKILRVDPSENVLIGLRAITGYLRLRSHSSLYKWISEYGLPVIPRHDGQLMTTMTAIDQWIWLGADLDNRLRPEARGLTHSRVKEKELLRRKLAKLEEGERRREASQDNTESDK